jgi:2-polyprenyl-3-methyl-5-hydroxy-6-metoxy-1,4-benzoquinol methylase
MNGSRIERELRHNKEILIDVEETWGWSSPAGTLRAKRRACFYREMGEIEKDLKVLELGCGTGIFTEEIAKSGASITAIDISEEFLSIARKKVPLKYVTFKNTSAEDMDFDDDTFDAVYGSSVLHHLHINTALKEIRRVLKPGGRLVFTEPNLLNPQVMLMFKLKAMKKRFGVSPDEMAFTRFFIKRKLVEHFFSEIIVINFDFLHPATPKAFIRPLSRLTELIERIPVINEISGSLLISARKGDHLG